MDKITTSMTSTTVNTPPQIEETKKPRHTCQVWANYVQTFVRGEEWTAKLTLRCKHCPLELECAEGEHDCVTKMDDHAQECKARQQMSKKAVQQSTLDLLKADSEAAAASTQDEEADAGVLSTEKREKINGPSWR
ncbi:hypothetical protein CLAFUR0_14489 [Fulvia fulva]|nr:hypothetical protein CLAFUR0_14489 [Fulvia fulva]